MVGIRGAVIGQCIRESSQTAAGITENHQILGIMDLDTTGITLVCAAQWKGKLCDKIINGLPIAEVHISCLPENFSEFFIQLIGIQGGGY